MKKNMFQRIALLALALVLVVGMLPATSASAEDATYNYTDELSPGTMKFKESTEDNYDFVSVAEAYDLCAYRIDMEYLLKDFDIDNYLKQNEKGYVFISNSNYNAKVRVSTNGGKNFSEKYPRQDIIGKDQYGDYIRVDRYDAEVCDFSRDNKESYENICTFGTVAIFLDVQKSPVTLTLNISSDNSLQNVVYSKKIKIENESMLNAIKSVDIYDFEFTGKHAVAMDTDAWSNVGNVISIKYLDENKENERTKLMAGDKGYIEFTIVVMQTNIVVEMDGYPVFSSEKAHWDKTVQSHIKGSAYSGVETNSASFFTSDDSKFCCKFYHYYEIADDEKYVIKKGTVNLIAPEAGAQASSKVGLANVDFFIVRNMKHDKFTAEENAAIWLNLDRRGKWKTVTSFSALNIYQALVKLEPRGNYYFNADSVAAMKVPGAEKFTIQYIKSGALDGIVKEDGWYLLATFPVVQPKTFDLAIGYDKPDMTVTQNDRAFLTATSSCDLTKASNVSVQWYYSSDISKDPNGELCGASDGDLKIQLETATVGTGYYKCVISCTVDGKTAVVSYPGGEWAKVTVKKASTPPPTEPTQKPTEPTQKPTEPTQKPTEPTTPPPTEPVSTDPNPTDPVSTDPNPTDPVSTDPVSTDPEATTPDSQPTTDPSGGDSTGPNTAPSGTVPQPTTPAPTGSGGHGGTGSENGGSGILQLWWLWLLLLLLIAAAVTFCIMKKRNGNHQEGETT